MSNIIRQLKRHLKSMHRLYQTKAHPFGEAEVAAGLAGLGVARGDWLLVHASFNSCLGFTAGPMRLIALLQQAVGAHGLLMMPSMPFSGSAINYVSSDPVFDPRATPSQMGLLTELFRRLPDTVRSVHPTHPVVLWGADAQRVAAGHHRAATPCGRGSPFTTLLENEGKILLIGTGIGAMTFYHTVEELLEKRLPASPFTTDTFRLRSRTRAGELVETTTRLFDPTLSRRRNLKPLKVELQQRGVWRAVRLGRLTLELVDTADVVAATRSLADRGVYCYG
jgi:aminoglycoside 3-N-acetyltransferase